MPKDNEINVNEAIPVVIDSLDELNRRLSALEQYKMNSEPAILKVGKSGNSLILNVTQICSKLGLKYGDYVKILLVKAD